MNADIVTALVGFGGAVVGAGASMGSAWLTQRHQTKQAEGDRLRDLGKVAVDIALSELIKLNDLLESTTPPTDTPSNESEPWEKQAKVHLRNVELALLRVPGRAVYARVVPTLELAKQYRWAGPRHFHYIKMMQLMVGDMITALSAYIRADTIPKPDRAVALTRAEVERRKAARAAAFLMDEPEPDYEEEDTAL
ncbi:hypothetical protein ABT270_04585 [Streptomyces sp900105245]|uniref:hypothetical protein n=1 Tax=Streptomyces sp. 900105245 TaxID=3154379 RepID=UPI003327C13B